MARSDRIHLGLLEWARGVVRRRLGLRWFRLWHRHVTLGPLCDVRAPTKFLVGANAVVTGELPPDVIAVGIPARVLRSRT